MVFSLQRASLSFSLPSMDFDALSVASVFHLVRHDRWPACGFFCQCTDHERETRVIVWSSLYWGVCPPFCESAPSERYTAGHGSVVDDEIWCPKSGYYSDMLVHEHARRCKGQDRGCGRVEFELQKMKGPEPLIFLTCRLPALLEMESTDGERRKDGVSKGAN